MNQTKRPKPSLVFVLQLSDGKELPLDLAAAEVLARSVLAVLPPKLTAQLAREVLSSERVRSSEALGLLGLEADYPEDDGSGPDLVDLNGRKVAWKRDG